MKMQKNSSGGVLSPGTSEETDDFVKKLYPFVDETVTPIPRGWSTTDKDQHLGVAHNKLKLTYRGEGDPFLLNLFFIYLFRFCLNYSVVFGVHFGGKMCDDFMTVTLKNVCVVVLIV